jgi:hypothetical protein
MTQTAAVKKPSRAQVNQLARDLGYVLGEKATTELINRAMQATDPEAFLRDQAAKRQAATTPPASEPAAAGQEPGAVMPEDIHPLTQGVNSEARDAVPAGPSVVIELPLAEPPTKGYARRFTKVELSFDHDQASIFQRLYYGLNSKSTRLATGKHVESAADVVRYLLEQAAAAAG